MEKNLDKALQANILHYILTDEQYEMLKELNVLDQMKLRNIFLRQEFIELKKSFNRETCINILQERYVSYIAFESIQKIIYSTKLPEEINGTNDSKENFDQPTGLIP